MIRSTAKLNAEQQKLAADNYGLAIHFANRYAPPVGIDQQEWESECLHRMCRAALTYKNSGAAFTTYAWRAMMRNKWGIAIANKRERRDCRRTVCLSEKTACKLPASSQVDMVETRDFARWCLGVLDLRDRCLLMRRALNINQREVGKEMGISGERVRQIEERALYLIRTRRELHRKGAPSI